MVRKGMKPIPKLNLDPAQRRQSAMPIGGFQGFQSPSKTERSSFKKRETLTNTSFQRIGS